MKVVSVIACGPSAIECGAVTSPGTRICVNDAYKHIECSHVVSMDGRWAFNRAKDFCHPMTPALHVRDQSWCKFGEIPDDCRYRTFVNERTKTLFSDLPGQLNGENSGYCALNLAYIIEPDRIYLYGFDMNYSSDGKDHFFGDYEWKGAGCKNSPDKFKRWASEMDAAAEQFEAKGIEVFNTNKKSAIKAFKYGRP